MEKNISGKLLSALIILIGESLFVFSEMYAAQQLSLSDDKFWLVFGYNMPIIFGGGLLVLLGYILGVKYFESIWVVVVISIFCMLLIEPLIAYSLFRTLPEIGALLGMVLSFIGCIYTFKED